MRKGNPRDLEGKEVTRVNFCGTDIEVEVEGGIIWRITPETVTSSSKDSNTQVASFTASSRLSWEVVRKPKAHAPVERDVFEEMEER